MSVFKVGSNKSSQNNFPSVRPTLDLDFANSKTLDPRITFTRASGGSYVGADGLIKYAGVNEPRFDHDPVTGESLGFLVEEARTNSLLQSSDLTEAGWSLAGFARTANSTTAPDGTNTAVKIASTTGTFGFLERSGVSSPAGVVTYSWYAKAAEANWFAIADIQFGLLVAYFNLATGTIGTRAAGTAHTITPVGNGWYRCSVTGSNTNLSSRWGCFASNSDNTLTPAPIGNGVHVWGPQLEAGAFPTSYIPTEASSRTRAADNATITGTNFSSWFRQGEGSFFINSAKTPTTNGVYFLCGDATDYIRAYAQGDGGSALQYFDAGPASTITISNSSQYQKRAFAYKVNDIAASINASTASTASSGQAPVASQLLIGNSTGSINCINGTIARLTYWPKKLTDAQLQVLTR